MKTNDNRQNTHNEIDRIFRVLLPTWNMAERRLFGALRHVPGGEKVLEYVIDLVMGVVPVIIVIHP